jgi:hypothetical protein
MTPADALAAIIAEWDSGRSGWRDDLSARLDGLSEVIEKARGVSVPPILTERQNSGDAPIQGQAAAIVHDGARYLARFPLAIMTRSEAWDAATRWRDENAPGAVVGWFTGRMMPIFENAQ